MTEIRSCYRIFDSVKDICEKCCDKLDKHVDYYGKKKTKDKLAIRKILLEGKVINEIYSGLMFAGYY